MVDTPRRIPFRERPEFPPVTEELLDALEARFKPAAYDHKTDPRLIDYQSGQMSILRFLRAQHQLQTER